MIVAPLVRLADSKLWYPDALHFLFQGGSFFEQFDSLAYGCMAATLFAHRRELVDFFYQKNPRLITWGGVALVLAPAALKLLHFPIYLRAMGFDSAQAVGFSLILLQSILQPERGFYRILNWAWVRHIGVLSYSIYIWQQMFCGTDETFFGPVFGPRPAWWAGFPMWILTVLLVAHASYYLLEKPFLGLRTRLRAVNN